MKQRVVRAVQYSVLCLVLFLQQSCDMVEEPVREFFERYSDSVAVIQWSADVSVITDSDGVRCIPSGSPVTIDFLVSNPSATAFSTNFTFDNAAVGSYTSYAAEGVYHIKMVLGTDFLEQNECGGDISGVVSLFTNGRTFDPYHFVARVNSPPDSVQHAVAMHDTVGGTKHYVLCFNLPTGAKNQDVRFISINGTPYEMHYDEDGKPIFSDSRFSSTSPGALEPILPVSDGGVIFSPDDVPVYFSTGTEFVGSSSGDKTSYSVQLIDEKGLTSDTVTISAIATKLDITISLHGTDYTDITLSLPNEPFEAGSELTLTVQEASGHTIKITSIVLRKLNGTTAASGTITDGTATITVPDTPAVYELYVQGTLDGNAWSAARQIGVVYAITNGG